MTITNETWHGTANGYKRHGCRCQGCSSAYSLRQREYRAANREHLLSRKRTHYAANRDERVEARRKYRAENLDHVRAVARKWGEENREQIASNVREKRYGVTPQRFLSLLSDQDGCCAICCSPFGETAPRIDHDHACCAGIKSCGNCVRGLLCHGCNAALGLLRDDPDRLRSAIGYLERVR